MSQGNTGWSVEQVGSDNPSPIPEETQSSLDALNRQYQNRSWWKKLKDWWLYPKGHRQILLRESDLSVDQLLLYRIHRLQIHEAARSHQLSMVTWLLVVVAFITLIVVLIK